MPKSGALLGYLNQIDEVGIYSNFGPLSKHLTSRVGDYFGVDEARIVLMTNAT